MVAHYRNCTRPRYLRSAHKTDISRIAAFPFLTLDSPNAFVNLVEFFDSGRARVPGSHPFLGKRPVVSRNPLKFADHYEWWSWETVDARRRQLGSGLHKLFADGVLGGPMRAVGIYSANSPCTSCFSRFGVPLLTQRVQHGSSSTCPPRHTRWCR